MKIASKIDPYEEGERLEYEILHLVNSDTIIEEAALQALKSEPVETAVFSKVKQEPGIKEEPIGEKRC